MVNDLLETVVLAVVETALLVLNLLAQFYLQLMLAVENKL